MNRLSPSDLIVDEEDRYSPHQKAASHRSNIPFSGISSGSGGLTGVSSPHLAERRQLVDPPLSQQEVKAHKLARESPRQYAIKHSSIATPFIKSNSTHAPTGAASSSSAHKAFTDTLFNPSSTLHMIDEVLKKSETGVVELVTKDHETAANQKELETHIREQLEQSKASLIEKYQQVQTNLNTELDTARKIHAATLKEKEDWWQVALKSKDAEIANMQKKMKDIADDGNKRVTDTERRLIDELDRQEVMWKERIAELEAQHESHIESVRAKHKFEMDSKILTSKAHLEANEDRIKKTYEKKLKKYEKQIREVIQTYNEKELVINGSLDEARRELLQVQNSVAAKERVLREEMVLKDKRMVAMQAQLHAVDEITRIADVWRSQARDLASVIIQACVSVRDLPNVPEAPKDLLSSVFQGFVKEEELNKERKHFHQELNIYNRLKADHVMIQKDLISRALQTSKRVVERVKAEIVPFIEYSVE